MNSEYRNPFPTADIIMEYADGRIVVIERKNEPRGLALPGGFVDEGESLEEAARREAMEETGLEPELTELLYVYSRPDRDPRFHTLSAVFIGRVEGEARAGDDAKRVFLMRPEELFGRLVFDHEEILRDYMRFKREGRRPSPAEMLERIAASRGS